PLAGLDRAEQGEECIHLYLPDPHVVQEVLGEGAQLLRCLDEPLQHGIGINLEHPRRATDTQTFGQARDNAYDELDRHPLAMKESPEGLEKRATTDDTQQLPAFSANNPPAHDRETGRKSSPGAGLRGDEGVKSAPGPS